MPNFFNKYPYTDFHELNLDFVLKEVQTMKDILSDFVPLNSIKYADPFNWNISNSYEENTIVLDAVHNIAYISKKAVPAGILITNSDYWLQVLDMSGITDHLNYVIPQMFGAVGDNITDDYNAIQAAANFAAANDKILVFPITSGYYCSQTVTFKDIESVLMYAPIYTDASIGIVINDDTQRWAVDDYKLQVINKTATYDNKTGIIIYNAYYGNIAIDTVMNFETGVLIAGNNYGNVYNTYYLGLIQGCNIGLLLKNNNTGWVNENLFINGTITVPSTHPYKNTCTGIYMQGNTSHYVNSNYFLKPCLEGLNTCVYISYGFANTIECARAELSTTHAIIKDGTSSRNKITITGTGNLIYIDDTSLSDNEIWMANNGVNNTFIPLINDGALNDITVTNSTEGYAGQYYGEIIHAAGTMHSLRRCTRTSSDLSYSGNETFGVMVDTSSAKRFFIGPTKNNVRRFCVCYDANGDPIDNSVYKVSGAQYNTYLGGNYAWIIGSNAKEGRYITVPDVCVKMFIGYYAMSNINEFQLLSTPDARLIPNEIPRGLASVPTCDANEGTVCNDYTGTVIGWKYYSNAWNVIS